MLVTAPTSAHLLAAAPLWAPQPAILLVMLAGQGMKQGMVKVQGMMVWVRAREMTA